MSRVPQHPVRPVRPVILVALLLAGCVHAPTLTVAREPGIAAHPDSLVFPVLDYHPPRDGDHRLELADGSLCYLASHSFVPLVRIEAVIPTDRDNEPAGITGLNGACFDLLAQGGGNGLSPAEFEDRVAFLGARFWSRQSAQGGIVGIELLSKDLDEGLDLLFGQLKAPAFDAQRLELWREQNLADLRQRNDDTRRLESLEWSRLLYSAEGAEGRVITDGDLAAVTPAALRDWHRRFFGPGPLSFRVSGDVSADRLRPALDSRLAGWSARLDPVPPRLPRYSGTAAGVYLLDKPVNQTRVRLALPGLERSDPRWITGDVLSSLLGGSFTSRLVQRIRSDEGLAYSVGCRLEDRHHGAGLFTGSMQTKAPSTLYALSLYRAELERLAAGELEDEELERVKKGLIEEFPGQFNTPAAIAEALHGEYLSGRLERDPRWFQDYRSRLAAVDRQAVISLARQLFTEQQPVWLLIGDARAIEAGDGVHELKLEEFGPVTRLSPRDPLSRQPLP